ncbi:DUF1822 family protein [Nostoc sp. FACHB-87]|uniref:DUF1822 family protein n=1 Tax=Nostocaceae TaxID=1162 RepID=UPI001687FA66|nr:MULTISPECIES: DUF1822 family protein [Nostocaceae]MBD2298167.1 DUF1822 family protein [Nostoc sp. FACHB-190]MBD2453106.1 DUF1822 family protein [Nostoc sp. FACHB-87]MBD2475114.1 DUF1822 family protein [Anabaena sp. FACHB-83]
MNYLNAITISTIAIESCVEISETTQDAVWQQSQNFSTPSTRLQAYLNRLCLLTVLPWLEEIWGIIAKPAPNLAVLHSFWEVVNGTAITINQTRLILIPSLAIDINEIRVPQEWVDIPSWAGDYYLAVQVNTEDGWVKVWGYTTHLQLKQPSNYSAGDRTYTLDYEDLIHDLDILWVTRQLCPDAPTKTEVEPLANLSLTQANNLLARLGNPAVKFPRLAIPFSLWGALLEHGGWRQRLYELRTGITQQWSIIQWIQTGISDLAQQLGWNYLDLETSLGSRGIAQTNEPVILTRHLIIAGQNYELQVQSPGEITSGIWVIELQSLSLQGLIPSGFKLRLLTEDLQPFPDNECVADTATEKLAIELQLEAGEGLVWEIEPTPENYEREILRF